MTKEEMVGLVVLNTRRSDKTVLAGSAIDLALNEIALRHEFHSLKAEAFASLTLGSTTVTLPDNVYQIKKVVLQASSTSFAHEVPLKLKSWVLERYPDLGEQLAVNLPAVVFREGTTLVFVPPATQDYTVRVTYRRLFPAIGDDDEPTDLTLTNAIVAWATSYVFRSIEEFLSADRWLGEYERSLRLAITADRARGEVHQHEGFVDEPYEPAANPWQDPFNSGRTGGW